MTKFEQYQNAINELEAKQIASGKGWNKGFQVMVDVLKNARDNMTVAEAMEEAV